LEPQAGNGSGAAYKYLWLASETANTLDIDSVIGYLLTQVASEFYWLLFGMDNGYVVAL